MSKLKCVNLGLPKSGTTTLQKALEDVGWLVADHKVRRTVAKYPDTGGTFIARQIYNGYFETGDPFRYLDFYDALGEINALNGPRSYWPQCEYALVQAMRASPANVKFVATWRPPADISDSVGRWSNLGSQRLPRANVPGLPHDFGGTDAERIRWIEGHYAMLRDIFAGDDRYLELDVGAEDARELLADHLGIKLGWWGRANVNTDNPARGAA
ncbi:MAG: hypothetical protein QNJ09_10125 [Paracoccaceae bacterium]|nr:hypothetical protein [Paracoccaceae bacterium]